MEITIEMLRRYCADSKVHVYFDSKGAILHADDPSHVPLELTEDELRARIAGSNGIQLARPTTRPLAAVDFLVAAEGHMDKRAGTYDKPEGERSMQQTVAVFNVFHRLQLTEAQGWHFMQILKDVRLFTRPTFHQDSAEDGVAYSALKAEAKANETPPAANDNKAPAAANRA